MQPINKKTIILASLSLILIIVTILAFLTFQKKSVLPNNEAESGVAGVSSSNTLETASYKPKPLKLELMNSEEKASFNISTSTDYRVQVLERDKSGKPITYKIIKSDADILSSY